jgi:pimeloyl-ACP methyl ester carboxylesterase
MVSRASGFRSVEARSGYCRLYDEAVAQSSSRIEESDVETSFGTTHVLHAGDPGRPPLVALHAKSMSSTMWIPLLPALMASHRVHLIDAVGDVNKSVATQVLSSPGRVVAWLRETTEALSVDRSPIVAASIGTCMAAHFAMAEPARVERLALVCPAGIVSRLHARWVLRGLVSLAATRVRPRPERVATFFDSMAMPTTRPRLRGGPVATRRAAVLRGHERLPHPGQRGEAGPLRPRPPRLLHHPRTGDRGGM